jgi:hypothetical protein
MSLNKQSLSAVASNDSRRFIHRDSAGPAVAPLFEIGAAVRVRKYARRVVKSVAGEQVTIVFPDKTERTFMANFVSPA